MRRNVIKASIIVMQLILIALYFATTPTPGPS